MYECMWSKSPSHIRTLVVFMWNIRCRYTLLNDCGITVLVYFLCSCPYRAQVTFWPPTPRALPWAMGSCPFRACFVHSISRHALRIPILHVPYFFIHATIALALIRLPLALLRPERAVAHSPGQRSDALAERRHPGLGFHGTLLGRPVRAAAFVSARCVSFGVHAVALTGRKLPFGLQHPGRCPGLWVVALSGRALCIPFQDTHCAFIFGRFAYPFQGVRCAFHFRTCVVHSFS